MTLDQIKQRRAQLQAQAVRLSEEMRKLNRLEVELRRYSAHADLLKKIESSADEERRLRQELQEL